MTIAFMGCGSSPTNSIDLHGVVTTDDLSEMPDDRLVNMLGHELPWTRLSAAKALAERGPQSASLFIDRLNEEDWRVVRAAQDGLIALLREANKDEDTDDGNEIRSAVIEAIPALKRNLQHEHYYVRMGGLQCLGALGADAAPAGDLICDRTEDEDYLGVVPTDRKSVV